MFARVAVNVPTITSLYDYAIPEELSKLQAGHLVTVPFGNQVVQAVIVELLSSPSVENPKQIQDLLDPLPVLTHAQLKAALHLGQTTLSPLASLVTLMLPPGLSQQADIVYELRREAPEGESSQVSTRLLTLLRERGALRGRQIDTHFAKVDWRKTAQNLVRKGVLTSKHVLPPPRVRAKQVRVAQLCVPPQTAMEHMPTLGLRQALPRRQAALQYLITQAEPINVSWVYAQTGCKLTDLEALEERGLIRLFESEIFRDSLASLDAGDSSQNFDLTDPQAAALASILETMQHGGAGLPFLLYGVTGSGKTEIYLRTAEEAIRSGRQAVILVPEIALTPQAVRRFHSRFPGQVGLIHSRLSEGERYDTWRRARSGDLKVILGPRSALFLPLANVGLIVVDECHDSSYYQSEVQPNYHAVTAALEYAKLCNAVCILGSATPTVEQRFKAENHQMLKLDLPKRIAQGGLPEVQIVDMRNELKNGNRGIFSRTLTEALAETITRGEQAILFLNRRGTATYIFCRDCGLVLKCPKCDTPLTLHTDQVSGLMCHRCGYTRNKPKTCPSCSGSQIREYGLGSEKVEADVQAMFPTVRTLRWDWDTTRKKDAHEIILTHFANHKADVLVGTQMLAKGLDLPLVTLVGIVLADVGLTLPDPFASERVFQTLTQVAGRAGRSALGGRVVMQTFMPEHYAIQHAAQHDVDGFYTRELAYRRELGYPPFSRLARLEYRHADPAKAEEEANKAAAKLRSQIDSSRLRQTEIIGPVPSFFSKVDGVHRWQIVARCPDPAALLADLKLSDWRIEIDPISLL